MRRWTLICLSLVLLTQPAVARSGQDAKAAKALARKHFEIAETHYDQGRFRQALEAYKKALSYKRYPAFLFNIAQCHRQLKEWKEALFFFKLYLARQPQAANRDEVLRLITLAQQKMALMTQAARQRGRLTVLTNPRGAQVFVDRLTGQPNGISPAILTLRAGTHLIAVRLGKHHAHHQSVKVVAGQVTVLEISLKPLMNSRGALPLPAEPRGPPPFYKRWWFWAGTGLAVAAIGVAVFTGVTTLDMERRWERSWPVPPDSSFESRYEAYRLSTDLLIGMGALAAVGVTIGALLVTRTKKENPKQAHIAPSCTDRGCGILLSGSF